MTPSATRQQLCGNGMTDGCSMQAENNASLGQHFLAVVRA
jgi:hypothetical protein